MSSKNSSKLITSILGYLRINNRIDSKYLEYIKSCINECILIINDLDSFVYIYRKYTYKLDFLNNEIYTNFLSGCDSYYLIACTFGSRIQKIINELSITDSEKMVIFDATLSALLEEKANDFEKGLGSNLTKRFCPGYSNTNIEDIKIIYNELEAYKIGIEVLDSCMLNPQKSMIGIIGIKNN